MKIVKEKKIEESNRRWLKKLANFFGRGSEAEEAKIILGLPFREAAGEIVTLAENLFVTYHNTDDPVSETYLITCKTILRSAYVANCDTKLYEVIFSYI